MLDLLASLLTLLYFTLSPHSPDPCFHLALALNLLHLLAYLSILLPITARILRAGTLRALRREYLRGRVMGGGWLWCGVLGVVSLGGLYGLVAEVFSWGSYGYLFGVFCVVGGSGTDVAGFVRGRVDCSVYFSVEVYKFFCLVVASVLFGISAHET